ncbi:MAG: hypothetical protein U0103_19910 [Candidatus Obscuribacterales bacterium]
MLSPVGANDEERGFVVGASVFAVVTSRSKITGFVDVVRDYLSSLFIVLTVVLFQTGAW